MDEPLGLAIGNALEVKETIETLNGIGPLDTTELVIEIAALVVSKINNIDVEEARVLCLKNIHNGEAYKKFIEFVNVQHGDISKIEISNRVLSIKAPSTGYIKNIDALGLGEIARLIGAGRLTKEDVIDYSVGLELAVKVGDKVNVGDELIKVYINEKDIEMNKILDCFTIVEEPTEKSKLIYEILD